MRSPLRLTATTVVGNNAIHLINAAIDLDAVPIPAELKPGIAGRVGKDELVAVVPGSAGITVVAKAREEAEEAYQRQASRSLGARLRGILNGERVGEASLVNAGNVTAERVLDVCEGISLSNYQFIKYKTGDRHKPNALEGLSVVSGNLAQGDLDRVSTIAAATCLARDLVNEPPSTLTATMLASAVAKVGEETGFKTTVLGRDEIASLGMGGLLAVNLGSVEPPAFIIMEHSPAGIEGEAPIVLVGKGVTYDTGGYSIKTSGMAGMKSDMAGAAAVVATMAAAASLALPLRIIGLVPATDNRIDGKAIVPDDVITMMSGTKVEVQNTDAEGRLILADALHYAKRLSPALVIDLATLTGAAARITDRHGSAMCADRAPQKELLKESGERVYERLMEFPMWREFHDAIKSDVADIRNMGGAAGGNITAATFLHHFTDYPWIHLDIAGPSMVDSDSDYRLKGATGVGVRLLMDFLQRLPAQG